MLIYYSLTLFVSAMLMFLVQPMIGKLLLPHLGGTPAVWNTCLVFFQAMLLVGYGYTHLLTTTQTPRRQVVIQTLVLLLPLSVLPFRLLDWEAPTETTPVYWLLAQLVVMVGLPFFAVSTTAPLLQKWFLHTGHAAAKDPYFLYGASNLGSMAGLALYPLVLEPWLPVTAETGDPTLATQVHAWSAGFALFVAMVLLCGVLVAWKPHEVAAVKSASSETLTGRRRLRWLAWSALPSSLMLGVTTHLTTDIAAAPFFWVLPLALYLLTFILVFARWPWVWIEKPHEIVSYVQPCLVVVLVFKVVGKLPTPLWVEFLIHLGAFVSTALLCHGELAKDRPGTKHLTEFYFWIALGGVVGGLFNALVAPSVFQFGVWEYPLALALACMLREAPMVDFKPLVSGDSTPRQATTLGRVLTWSVPLALGAAAFHLITAASDPATAFWALRRPLWLLVPCAILLGLLWRPVRFGLAVLALFVGVGFADRILMPVVYEGRSFFGMLRVRVDGGLVKLPRAPGAELPPIERTSYRILMHGGVNHGAQIVACGDEAGNELPALTRIKRRTPIMYFHERNGVAEVFHKLAWPDAPGVGSGLTIGRADARLAASMVGLASGDHAAWSMLANTQSEPPIAVLGLGSGILACYAKPFQRVDFFEIDPLVRDLSIVPGYVPPWHGDRTRMSGKVADPVFSFVHDAQERGALINVVLGDGRFKLRDAPAGYYHVLCLDVFSSDAIPVHLLTAEAIDLYMSRLADGGVLLCNTSNRHVAVSRILASIARARGHACLVCTDDTHAEDHPERANAEWLVIQRKAGGIRNGIPPIHERLLKERKRLAWTGQPVSDVGMEQRWREIAPLPGPVWTDRYSNLLDPNVMPWLRLF